MRCRVVGHACAVCRVPSGCRALRHRLALTFCRAARPRRTRTLARSPMRTLAAVVDTFPRPAARVSHLPRRASLRPLANQCALVVPMRATGPMSRCALAPPSPHPRPSPLRHVHPRAWSPRAHRATLATVATTTCLPPPPYLRLPPPQLLPTPAATACATAIARSDTTIDWGS